MYIMTGDGHWIQEVKNNGKIIVLEDGSKWEVASLDTIDSSLWLPVSNITVLDGDDPVYSYKLVNTDDNEVVDAKYLKG